MTICLLHGHLTNFELEIALLPDNTLEKTFLLVRIKFYLAEIQNNMSPDMPIWQNAKE